MADLSTLLGAKVHFSNIFFIIEAISIILLLVCGLFGGFLSGLLGVGGGIIYVVLFTEFTYYLYNEFALSDSDVLKIAIANSMFATMFASFIGSIRQYRANNFYWQTVVTIGIPAIISSLATSYTLRYVYYSKTTFSVIFVSLLVPLIYRMLKNSGKSKIVQRPYQLKVTLLIITGLFTGIMSALSGLGGAFAIVPVLNRVFHIKIHKVVSISLGVVFCIASVNALFFLFVGNIEYTLPYMKGNISGMSIPVIIGATLGAPLGVHSAKYFSPFLLRFLFVGFCSILILKILWGMMG